MESIKAEAWPASSPDPSLSHLHDLSKLRSLSCRAHQVVFVSNGMVTLEVLCNVYKIAVMTSTVWGASYKPGSERKGLRSVLIRRVGSLLIMPAVLGTCHIPDPCSLLFTPDDNTGETVCSEK